MGLNLVPPCSYQGGKQRLAKQIVDIIYEDNNITDETQFYDLCCGSGAISIGMINNGFCDFNITMVDASPWGLFYQRVGDLTFSTDVFKLYIDDIPKDITKIKDYAEKMIKMQANDGLFDNMVYKFLILQACAFGSTATWVEDNKWKKSGGLRNYWMPTPKSNRRSPVNPMMPMPNTLFERVENICSYMDGIKGIYGKVEDVEILNGSIIYLDPPYKETCDYGYDIDYMEYINNLLNTKNNIKIYLSEGYPIYSANKQILLSTGRRKGNISGNTKNKPTEEWLNVFCN